MVNEHLPASLRACSGVMEFVWRCVCSCCGMLWMRSRHGATVMCSVSQPMMTPWMRCDGSGGWRLDFFMWNPRMELTCSNVSNPDCAVLAGSMDP